MSLRGRHVRTSATRTCRFLIVTVGGVHFALQADHVQGLLTVEEAGSSESLTIQGLTYAKMDLAARLQLAHDPSGPETRVVLVAKGQARAYMWVSQVHGLKEMEQSQVLPLPRQFRGEEQGWYQGMVLFEASMALVLNPVWVMAGCEAGLGTEAGASQVGPAPFLTARPALAGGQA